MNYLINFWKVSLLKFQAEDIVGCQGMEPRNSPGCSDRCLRLAWDTHLSPLLGPWPPVCFFSQEISILPMQTPTDQQPALKYSIAWLLPLGWRQSLLAGPSGSSCPALPSPLPWRSVISSPLQRSGTAPARAPPILVFVPFFMLFLCKSHSHPSRLGSNISSLRHNVAFCQFWSFF